MRFRIKLAAAPIALAMHGELQKTAHQRGMAAAEICRRALATALEQHRLELEQGGEFGSSPTHAVWRIRACSGFGQGAPAPRDQVAPAGAREGGRNLAALGLRRKSGIQPCRLNQRTMFAKLCAPVLSTSGRPMTRFGHCNQKHARVLPSALPDCWKSMARWRAPARLMRVAALAAAMKNPSQTGGRG